MAIGRTNCGVGGGGLNFQVVGGTTQPTSPKENTIWVNTSASITSWAFQTKQPAGAEGLVWFQTSTGSSVPFNGLSKNTLMVYPKSAMLYTSGSWSSVSPKIYQNGAWHDFTFYLYADGNECTNLTGGWTAQKKTTTNMTAGGSHEASASSVLITHTNNKIDLADYTTLYFETSEVVVTRADRVDFYFGAGSSKTSFTVYTREGSKTTGKTYQVDVSNLSGEYYILAGSHHVSTGSGTVYETKAVIKKVWCE